jgi:hypothetical protein
VELTVVDSRDLPQRLRVLVHIPNTLEVTIVVFRPRIQNSELNMGDWLIMSHKVTEKEQMLAFSIDPDSFKALVNLHHSRAASLPHSHTRGNFVWL